MFPVQRVAAIVASLAAAKSFLFPFILIFFKENNPRFFERKKNPQYLIRVPTQVLQSLIKSYFSFSIYKALQSLIFWVFSPTRSYKVLFIKGKKKGFRIRNAVSTLE